MNKLKFLREERGYSTRGMEIKTGINYNCICRYENESRDFNTSVLKKLADFFEVSIDYLLCYSGCFVYADYEIEHFTFKIRDDFYHTLKESGVIYFKDDKRYVNLNKLIGVSDNSNILGLFIEFTRIKKMDSLFDKKNPSISDIEELKKEIIDIELNNELIEAIKDAVN